MIMGPSVAIIVVQGARARVLMSGVWMAGCIRAASRACAGTCRCSQFAMAFLLRNSSLQNVRGFETDEFESAATFLFILANTIDASKMSLFGVSLCIAFIALSLRYYAFIKENRCFRG